MKTPSFLNTYQQLLSDLMYKPAPETNQRTGAVIYSLPPQSFDVDLSDRQLPVIGIRKLFPRTAAAEVAWFLKGDQDVTFIKKYAPIWDKFTEDDGVTIDAAYGYRWRKHFNRDQIGKAIDALSDNSTDRRVFISAWDPANDGLGNPGKNVPCPVGFTLSIRDGKLNSALLIRSSDVFVGLPYDVMGHALLMDAVSASIGHKQGHDGPIPLGTMHVTLAHPHLYDVHLEMASLAFNHTPSDETFTMPGWPVGRIASIPDAYVECVTELAKDVTQPEYHCRPAVVQ